MSFDVGEIQRRIDSINLKEDSIDNDHILYIVFHQISKIKKTKIDKDKSKFIIKNTCNYELKIISKNDQNCSFYISIFDNKIDFQLNHGGEYLYLQPINSIDNIAKLRLAICDFLQSPINETIKSCRDKIISAEYIVNHLINNNNKSESFHYNIIIGNCFPWQTKKTKTLLYEPWIE